MSTMAAEIKLVKEKKRIICNMLKKRKESYTIREQN
jgi:hypothetical protein